jgi:hypothetical protein
MTLESLPALPKEHPLLFHHLQRGGLARARVRPSGSDDVYPSLLKRPRTICLSSLARTMGVTSRFAMGSIRPLAGRSSVTVSGFATNILAMSELQTNNQTNKLIGSVRIRRTRIVRGLLSLLGHSSLGVADQDDVEAFCTAGECELLSVMRPSVGINLFLWKPR